MPYRTQPSRRGTRDKLVSTQDKDSLGFLPVGMRATRGWLLSQAYLFPTAWKSLICIHSNDHITWNNKSFEMSWWYKRVNEHTKNIMPGFRMLAFKVWRGGGALQNFWKFSSSLQNPIFKNMQITHISKTIQKSYLENFQINLKIN